MDLQKQVETNTNSPNINELINSIVNNDIDTFKKLITPDLLKISFADPDFPNKQINVLNLILSYQDKTFFNALLPSLNADIINNSLPDSALFYAVKASQEDSYFVDELLKFNPNLDVKDNRGNNLLNSLIVTPILLTNLIDKAMAANVSPFLNRGNSRENAYCTALEMNRLDLAEIYTTYPSFVKECTEQHLTTLIRKDFGLEFKRIIQKHDVLKDLLDDNLFNQSCSSQNIVALDTILEETFFIPGKEQLSLLVKLMCQKYDNEVNTQAALSIANYLFTIKIPFDKFTDPNGKNAWALSIEHNNNEIFDLLLKSPSTLNFVDDEKLSPLMYAVQEENLDFVKAIVAKKPYLMHKDLAGNTALLQAVFRRNEEIVEFLSKQPNIGVNEANNNKQTPLNTAIKFQNIPMVNSLAWSGANISLYPYETIEDNSVFGFDANNNYTTLLEQQDYKTIDNFQALIVKGFNPNQTNEKGETLVNHFIKEGYLQNFQSLVRCRIDIEVPDKNGNPPLFNAFEKDQDDFAILILNFHHHLNLEHKNNNGENIYDLASYCNSARKVSELVKSDDNISPENLNKVLPLLAMDANFYNLDKLKNIINFNFIDQNNNDLLMLSALTGNVDNFEYFQLHGNLKPDLKHKNSIGKNLFDIIHELSDENKNAFITKMSNSHKEKFENFEKKKRLELSQNKI